MRELESVSVSECQVEGLLTQSSEKLLSELLDSLESAKSSKSDVEADKLLSRIADLESQQTDDDDERVGISKLERDREKTEEAQEIGPLPPVANPVRKESCRFDLRRYMVTYFLPAVSFETPDKTLEHRGFAPYQEQAIKELQDVFLKGGNVAIAVRRGGLKSTLARLAVLWAVDYGHAAYVVLLGATTAKAHDHRSNLVKQLVSSQVHQADFPEQTALVNKFKQPKKGIRIDGELVTVSAKDDHGCILYPDLPKSLSSESRIAPYSIRATDISGLSFVDDRGKPIRPTIVVHDDVQTPQSAMSAKQTGDREHAIDTTIQGLAPLGQTMRNVMICTVREADCLSMRYLDSKRHPDWKGLRCPVLLQDPDAETKPLWDQYEEALRESAETPRERFDIAKALYLANRSAMDAGGLVAWEQDHPPEFVSAIQWCMTEKILRPDFFRTEMQQEGRRPAGGITSQLRIDELIKRYSGIPVGVVPSQATWLTCHVDSSDHVLWYMVCAWTSEFSGWCVKAGTWPPQGRAIFYKEALLRTIEMELPGKSWEEQFVHAHNQLDDLLLGTEWPIEGSGTRRIDLLLKDWSDGSHMARLRPQVMNSKHRALIRPAKGFAPKPGRKSVHDYGNDKRDRQIGCEWIERRTEQPYHVQFNANYWKLFAMRRLMTTPGAPASLMLPGHDERSLILLAEHLTSERAVTESRDGFDGIAFEELGNRDNDWWDTLVGNCVAASMLGCALVGERTKKKAVRFSQTTRAAINGVGDRAFFANARG